MDGLYVDGGCVRKNPSPHGATWAWCHINKEGQMLQSGSGIMSPKELGLPLVSNNIAEVVAACAALEAMPPAWSGTLYTDSEVTVARLIRTPKFKGVPPALRDRIHQVRCRVGAMQVVLLSGHPTRKQLADGRGKGGRPVSQWNVWCDRECRRLSKLALATVAEITEAASG